MLPSRSGLGSEGMTQPATPIRLPDGSCYLSGSLILLSKS